MALAGSRLLHLHLLTPLDFLQGSSGLNVEQRMFDVLVERKHPRLIEVFDRLECSLGGLTGDWFSRMFTTALPAETTARVWDCVMVEGPKVLFRAALSLIKVSLPCSQHDKCCTPVMSKSWHLPACACC